MQQRGDPYTHLWGGEGEEGTKMEKGEKKRSSFWGFLQIKHTHNHKQDLLVVIVLCKSKSSQHNIHYAHAIVEHRH